MAQLDCALNLEVVNEWFFWRKTELKIGLLGRAREGHSKEAPSEQGHPAPECPKKRHIFHCLRVVSTYPVKPTFCLHFVSMLSKQHFRSSSSFPGTINWDENFLDGKDNNSGHLERMSLLKWIDRWLVYRVLSLMCLITVSQGYQYLWMSQGRHECLETPR